MLEYKISEMVWNRLDWAGTGMNWLECAGMGLNRLEYAFFWPKMRMVLSPLVPLNYIPEFGTDLLSTSYCNIQLFLGNFFVSNEGIQRLKGIHWLN